MEMGQSGITSSLVAIILAAMINVATADVPHSTDLYSYQTGALGTQPNQTFFSSPIVAPVLQVNRFYPDRINASSAPYMFTAGGWNGSWGSLIYSSADLSLVYQDFSFKGLAQATQTFEYDGERVYSALQGAAMRVYDQSYDQLFAMRPQGDLLGEDPDTHEAQITSDGNVLLVICPAETVDLTSGGGPTDGEVANCKFQEIDPKTDEVLFEFSSLDHFDPFDSVWSYTEGERWDYAHQNSVQKLPDGDYIASYRHLSAVIKVSGETGKVKWVMGGKRNDFEDISERPGAAEFGYQHEARVWGEDARNRFTIFDNARLDNGFCTSIEDHCSRGLELEYDEQAMTVKTVQEWYHPQSLVSASRAGLQKMDNGHVFVAWGQNYGWTEYDENGDCILDFQRGMMARSGPNDITELVVYRGWKSDWTPSPSWGPRIASDAGNMVYVSWNGMMVSEWVLLAGDTLTSTNRAVARSPRNGFETSFDLAGLDGPMFARVAGLDNDGSVLGSTRIVEVATGKISKAKGPVKLSSDDLARADMSTSSSIPMPTGDASTKQIVPEGSAHEVGLDLRLVMIALTLFAQNQ